MSQTPADVNSDRSWDYARRYAAILEPVPSSVSEAVRTLWRTHLENVASGEEKIDAKAYDSARRVDRSAVLKTPLYFAALSLHPDLFGEIKEDDASKALIRILKPGFFAALLGLVYFHRRLNKICPKEQWEQLSKEFVLNMELGYLVGSGCPSLGKAVGTLVGGVRYAALAAMLIRDAEQYGRYRNARQGKFDLIFEHERWGCDHGQIAGFLLKGLGLELDPQHIAWAIRKDPGDLPKVPKGLRPWLGSVMVIDAIKDNTPLAQLGLEKLDVSLSDDDYKNIGEAVGKLFQVGSSFTWMFKSSDKQDAKDADA